jgi:hypothetical protein
MTQSELSFLGEEFLTWLWWRIEAGGGEFALGRNQTLGVSLDDYLMFAPHVEDEVEQTLRKGGPSRSAEARAALHNGRRVRRARLVLGDGDRNFGVTVDGPTMRLGSIRLPPDPEDANDPGERSEERIAGFRRVAELVELLYRQFLRERLRPDYLQTSGAQQASWMHGA